MGNRERAGRQLSHTARLPQPRQHELPFASMPSTGLVEFERLPPEHAFIMEELREPFFIPVCDMIHSDPVSGREKNYGYVTVDEYGVRTVHSGIYVVNFRVNHTDAINWLMLHFAECHHIDPNKITYLDENQTDFAPYGHLHAVPPQKIPVWSNVAF